MKIERLFSILTVAFMVTSCLLSCNKEKQPGGGDDPDPEEEVTEINGTKILEGNNAVGLISDENGKGIEGVPVTDGYSYTTTDKNGVYQMKANRYCRIVYMSVPSNYKIPVDPATNTPLFYSTKEFDKNKVNRNDFKLESQAVEEKFTMIMIGDPQCQSDSDVSRYKGETVPDIQATLNANSSLYVNPYCVTLGDVTFDSYDMWGPMKSSMSNVKLQNGKYLLFFQCIGNHDHNSKVDGTDKDATQKFVDTFGPTDYSFNRGKVHVVVMDDICVTTRKSNSSPNGATWEYDEDLTEQQVKWLTADLDQVKDKSDKTVFLCMHAPMRGAKAFTQQANVLPLLSKFKYAHIMIGHTHYQQNYIHSYVSAGGKKIYEHIHGTACGGWWCCNSSVTGSPCGYNIYQITEGNLVTNWILKGTNRQADYQMRAYDGNKLLTGSKGYQLYWYNTSQKAGAAGITVKGNAAFQNCVIAEIFDDDDQYWDVQFYQDGVSKGKLQKVANGGSCNVALANYFFNELGKNTDTWSNKTASHYWYFPAPSISTMQNWEIRAVQTIPDSGVQNTYSVGRLTNDNGEF